jgi:dTDP-4-amino-4,6-dideoxygalactose transaminase
MPVYITRRICEMSRLEEISARHKLVVIEDAAQSIRSTYHGHKSVSFGALLNLGIRLS